MFVEEDEIKILKDNEMLKLKKKEGKKVFTNEGRNIIIRKGYNPLTVNCKNYERGGLFMEKTKEGVLNKLAKTLSKKYYQREEFITLLIKICLDFEIKDYKVIEKFLINKEKDIKKLATF